MMGIFGSRKPGKRQPQTAAATRNRVDSQMSAHQAFQLKSGMDKDAVVRLLGVGFTAVTRGRMEYWLYSNSRHEIEIVFDSGLLDSVKFKEKNPNGSMTLLMEIKEDELTDAVGEAGRIVQLRPTGQGVVVCPSCGSSQFRLKRVKSPQDPVDVKKLYCEDCGFLMKTSDFHPNA